MNNLKNSVQLIGHLGAEPEMKTLEKGTLVTHIRIATTERFKNTLNEWQDDTQWHSCTLWDNLAQRASNYLKKGSHILVHGKLVHRHYDDTHGIRRYITEIRVNSFLILDKKQSDPPAVASASPPHTANDDALPF